MAQMIADIYEIQNKIGAGGGGVVYLGKHLRLDKQVVLKADKRTLNTGMEKLRREVDMLKELSQTYIPQVYDFVQDNGVVYTVMDYIEGESLDKLIGRGQIPEQPQLIKWACQLLEALDYLHGRPPYGILHGDIKPANIMLRPNGDICLIDFNIALALGEEGAVKVGFSRGYASPEHYGADYISRNRPAAVGTFSQSRNSESEDVGPKHAVHGETMLTGAAGDMGKTVLTDGAGDMEKTVLTGAADAMGKTVLTDAPDAMGKTAWIDAADAIEKIVGIDGAGDIGKTAPVNERGDIERTAIVGGDEDAERTWLIHHGENAGEGVSENAEGFRPVGVSAADGQSAGVLGSLGSSKKGIMLDVRSDIYSLGATLYHIISGVRPAEDAREVERLGENICSPGVAAILEKAMAPEPDMRYQTAKEMLNAFLQLSKCDARVIRRRKRILLSTAMLSTLFIAGGICSFIGLKQMEQMQEAFALAEYSANSLAKGDVEMAVEQALRAIPDGTGILEAPVTAQAQKALTDALGVYQLSDGFWPLGILRLPAAPFDMAVSPSGARVAVVYAYEAAVYDMETQQKIVSFPVCQSALSDVAFADESHMIYAGENGVTAYDLDSGKSLWTGEAATTLTVSSDGGTVAAVNRDEDCAAVYRTEDGEKVAECSFDGQHLWVASNDIFADPGKNIFALNKDGSLLAVSFSDGGLKVFDLYREENSTVIYENSDYGRFEGGFCGKYFAFTAEKSGESLFGLADMDKGVYLGGYESRNGLLLQADETGICLADGNLLVHINPETMEEQELAYTGNASITAFYAGKEYVLTETDDNRFSFYDRGAHLVSAQNGDVNYDFVKLAGDYAVLGSRNEPSLRMLKLEKHEEAQLLSYDARYKHDEARISQDGKTAMLFSYQDFRIYDMDGNMLVQKELPDGDSIYDQQFVRDEADSWLEVIWYDGTVRRYSARDGALIAEETGERPSKDLYEEFYTEEYRVTSSLHDAPEVYDLESGKLAAVLEEESYLTYVTQIGDYLMTEYISSEGKRYGILLDENFQKLAELPDLCDVIGDTLIFDYESGNLRQCRLYSLQELVDLGETYATKK